VSAKDFEHMKAWPIGEVIGFVAALHSEWRETRAKRSQVELFLREADAELSKLRARLADRERRIRLMAKAAAGINMWEGDGTALDRIRDAADLRKPLRPKGRRRFK
jgi:hypothetical protein